MEKAARKELIARYNERKMVGGVYAIKNINSGKTLLETTADLGASKNRFDFSQKNNLCPIGKIQHDWNESGSGSFVFEVLDEHSKSDSQTMNEFRDDLDAMKELWREKLSRDNTVLY